MVSSLLLGWSLAVAPAAAGSISTAGYTAGPDSNAAAANAAAAHFNPAALAATSGVQAMIDVQYSFVRIDYLATRNGGIDPNTGAAYEVASARVGVPNALVGLSAQVIPDRLSLGLALTDTFLGGGNYTANEPDEAFPYEGSQRYAGVVSKLITLHVIPAVGLTVVDGLHVGGGFKYIFDSVYIQQCSDPLGAEGALYYPPDAYASDTLLEIQATGGHLGWNAGVLFDRFEKARIGASFAWNGAIDTAGEASLDATLIGVEDVVEATTTFQAALPPVIYAWADSQVTDDLNLGVGGEVQLWGACCGTAEGDIAIGLTSEDGDPLGTEDGLTRDMDPTIYSPRRLHNSVNLAAAGGYAVGDHFWLGGRLGWQGTAVPDYAVSATNLDFPSVGAMLAGRFRTEHVELGLSYTKFFLLDRTITNSAWDVRDPDDPDWVDDRFSPEYPFKASADGEYSGAVDTVGVRIGGRF